MTKYQGAQEIWKTYEISSETLRRWNKISSIRTPGGNRLYSVADVEKLFGNQERLNEKKKICYTRVRSVQKSRKKILTGNASTSGRNVQTTNSSRTSDQVSTGNARVSRPFWNNHTEEISRRLWLPARTGSAASLLNLLNGSLLSTIQSSWNSVQTSTLMTPNPVSLPKTYYRSLLSSWQDTMGSDQPRIKNDKEKLKTQKIQIYSISKEREKLKN